MNPESTSNAISPKYHLEQVATEAGQDTPRRLPQRGEETVRTKGRSSTFETLQEMVFRTHLQQRNSGDLYQAEMQPPYTTEQRGRHRRNEASSEASGRLLQLTPHITTGCETLAQQDAVSESMQTGEAAPQATAQAQAAQAARDPEMLREQILLAPPVTVDQYNHQLQTILGDIGKLENQCRKALTIVLSRFENARTASASVKPLNHDQWQKLTKWHAWLLDAHHDFLIASFHPMGTGVHRKRYEAQRLPAHMWIYGIRNYLELLRANIDQPGVREHADTFLNLVQNHLNLLKETVPGDKHLPEAEQVAPDLDLAWLEALGDVARHRKAMSNELDSRKDWNRVATQHFHEVLARTPTQGRLFHHLAVMTDDLVERLSLLGQATYALIPFPRARDTLLMVDINDPTWVEPPLCPTLVHLQKALISGHLVNADDERNFFRELRYAIKRHSSRFRTVGPHLASALLAGVVGFGAQDSDILRSLVPLNQEGLTPLASALPIPEQGGRPPLRVAHHLAFTAFTDVVARVNVTASATACNLLPFVHVFMNFLQGTMPIAVDQIAASNLHWAGIALMLNRLADPHFADTASLLQERAGNRRSSKIQERLLEVHKPVPPIASAGNEYAEKATFLPEDITMLGAAWNTQQNSEALTHLIQHLAEQQDLPETGTSHAQNQARIGRILGLAKQLTQNCPWLDFDASTARFCAVLPDHVK